MLRLGFTTARGLSDVLVLRGDRGGGLVAVSLGGTGVTDLTAGVELEEVDTMWSVGWIEDSVEVSGKAAGAGIFAGDTAVGRPVDTGRRTATVRPQIWSGPRSRGLRRQGR